MPFDVSWLCCIFHSVFLKYMYKVWLKKLQIVYEPTTFREVGEKLRDIEYKEWSERKYNLLVIWLARWYLHQSGVINVLKHN